MPVREIHDPVYGEQHLHESVLLELLESPAILRLKGIHQAGASYLVSARRDTTRYEHSVGVMLLIRRLGGSVEEQAAGLIHDVAHTAFSHVADYVFARSGEDFHEQRFLHLVQNSDIPTILKRHALSPEAVLDLERWPLLEQPAPDLCADRIDYTLRDLLRVGYITEEEIARFLQALRVHEHRIVTNSVESAAWFTRQYARLLLELFMHPLEMFADNQLARALRIALDTGSLNEADLFLQDEELLQRLRTLQNPEIACCLARLRPGVQAVEDEQRYDIHAFVKPRVVDPLVLIEDDSTRRCSELEPGIAELQERVLQKARRGVFIRALA